MHFSDDYFHNFRRSAVVHNPENEVIVVDNRENAHFVNLGEAMNHGLQKAKNAVVIFAHEDVFFPDHWQEHFEEALRALEATDLDWGLIGVGGWLEDGTFVGRLSDPHGNHDTFGNKHFQEVQFPDEQILVLKNDGRILLDANLPSIHNIGRDLAFGARRLNRASYVVNAPTIHKYADALGNIIHSKDDSPKIKDRSQLAFAAEWQCSNEYLNWKWGQPSLVVPAKLDPEQEEILDHPLVLVGRGGGGSRVISALAEDFGLFIGKDVSQSGDSLEMVMPIYKGVIRKFCCKNQWQKDAIVPDLRGTALEMLKNSGWPAFWGFKLPESIYLIPEILEAFPHARFLYLLRDPIATCLRRTHMTARVDNQIGRAVIPAAYDHIGRSRSLIHTDEPPIVMAITTIHQLDSASISLAHERTYEVRFESIMKAPDFVTDRVADWLHRSPLRRTLASKVDRSRAENPSKSYSEQIEAKVRKCLTPLRIKLGYSSE